MKEQLKQGELAPDQFGEEVNKLRMQDESGSWWQIRETDGKWLKWDGSQWSEPSS